MRQGLWLCSAFLLSTSALAADNDQVKRGPPPPWAVISSPMPVPADAAGALFFRSQDAEAHVDAKGQQTFSAYRVKILNSSALEAGNLSVEWNPAAGSPTVHTIKVHRDKEVIDVLDKASFQILRREDQLEQARLDGNLTAVLRIPDLRVGDELEVAMTLPTGDPTLGKDDAGLLMLAPEPAPGRYHLALSWDEGARPRVQMSPDVAAVARQGGNKIDVLYDNPASLNPPKDSPPRYAWQRVIEYSSFDSWPSMSRRFATLFDKAATLEPNSPLKKEAARIAAANATPLDRARAALKMVQQDVRYIYVGLDGGNLTPASADETWRRRYGDCKAKTALLLALLREMGIGGEAVLANNSGADDGMDQRLPSPRMFDHVLVRADIGGKPYWMDGTLPAVVPPSTSPALPYRWVLPLAARGASIEHLPWSPAAQPEEITLFDIDARGGFDKPAKITSTIIRRGVPALVEQVQFSALTPGQILSAFRQNATGNTWQAIDDVRWRYDEKAQASVLTVVGTGTVDWEQHGAGIKTYSLPGGGFYPPDKRVRPAGQDQKLPYYNAPAYNCSVTTLRLPSTTTAGQWFHADPIDTRLFGKAYYRAFDVRDGALRMVRGSRIEQVEVDAASAARDNDRIAAFDNGQAQVTFDPGARAAVLAKGVKVPTTDEIDWTADSVPCLSSLARK